MVDTTFILNEDEITIRKSCCPGFINVIHKQITIPVDATNCIVSKLPPMCKMIKCLDQFIENGRGLEIGGPSLAMMSTNIYTKSAVLDNVNYAPKTLWNEHKNGEPYSFAGKTSPGVSYTGDIVNLSEKIHPPYDFVFASHVLEHIVNPLKGLDEVNKVLRPGGYCILVLPFKDNTFDHRRPITEFKELKEHYDENRNEGDVMDHVTKELLQQYDFTRDLPAKDIPTFVERCTHNASNRALHVHVFDFDLIGRCLDFCGFTPIYMQLAEGIHQIVIGKKRHIEALASTPASMQVSIPAFTVKKCLIVYTFHVMTSNVTFFLRYGMFESNIYDFMVVINDLNIKIYLPKYVTVINRHNIGYDFGAWGVGIHSINRDTYSHFILINSSVIGPFVKSTQPWQERFLCKLDEQTKLVGTTINCTGYGWGYIPRVTPHVQSMVLAMSRNTLELLIQKEIISNTIFEESFIKLILKCELGTSRAVLDDNSNIASLVPLFDKVDFRYPKNTDPLCHNIYFPIFLSKICIASDLVFVKTKMTRLNEIFKWTNIYNNSEIVNNISYNGIDIMSRVMDLTKAGPWCTLSNVDLYTQQPPVGKWMINNKEPRKCIQTLLFTRKHTKLAYSFLTM